MSTDPQGAGWTDSLRLSRRTLLRFLPRRLSDAHRPIQAEVERDMAASEPPQTVTGGELNTHSRQDLGQFLERLENNAALAGSATGADSRKDDRGPEEEL